ncbi:metallophosphoesterase [Paraflavisolibacter sp. H34]|uniref:metallophosphoesterase n=1 Tax=Huijunlia imazamoxiresistens TaxID=3127457 RepID=UPI003016C1F8
MKPVYWKWGAAAGAAVVGAALLDALVLERYFFQLKKIHIGNKESRRKLRLLLLTDLHLKDSVWPFHSRLARKINQLAPDLILISGDTVDTTGKAATADRFFGLLHPHLPKAAILGNHDHLEPDSLERLKSVFHKHNCHLLVNDSKCFEIDGVRLTVTGVDDFIEGCPSFTEAVKEVVCEDHHILLVHSPLQQEGVLKELRRINETRSADRRLNIGYIFAGHNHGGQVRLPGYVPVLPKYSGNYVNGWYNRQAPYLYVSRGFGTTALPFRFGARAEVTLFHYGV